MREWSRTVAFEAKERQREVWSCKDSRVEKCFDVEVTLGKPIDILSLKKNIIVDFRSNVFKIKSSRNALFRRGDLEKVSLCPICNAKTEFNREVFRVYGARYCQCKNCSHCYLMERPTKEVLDQFYCANTMYQGTYADKRTSKIRVKEVAVPKVRWMIEQFKRSYGKALKRVLDIGAGSGHFVYACRKLGMDAEGIELSETGRGFCKNNFGFELKDSDFIADWKNFKGYDVITFWGVIEHVPYPLKMLEAASSALSGKDGLVIAEVPRWSCFSTLVQSFFSNSVVRHLDPLGHIHCFTDSSLATSFCKSNLDIVSAWYFGMDIYEFIIQSSQLFNNNQAMRKLRSHIPILQSGLDLAKLSDEMVFAGKPRN